MLATTRGWLADKKWEKQLRIWQEISKISENLTNSERELRKWQEMIKWMTLIMTQMTVIAPGENGINLARHMKMWD